MTLSEIIPGLALLTIVACGFGGWIFRSVIGTAQREMGDEA